MFIKKERFLVYIFSLFLLTTFINTIPIHQPVKYILFIVINFFFFVFPNKTKFYKKIDFLISFCIFILIIILINLSPIKFSFSTYSFSHIDLNKISDESKNFYISNYSECNLNKSKCFWIDGPRQAELIYGSETQNNNNINKKVKNIFFRNYLNISNLNELRSNLFSSPGTTMDYNNKYINNTNYPFILKFKFPDLYINSTLCAPNTESKQICQNITEVNKNFEIINKGEKNRIYLKQNFKIMVIKFLFSFILLISLYNLLKKIYIFEIKKKITLLYPLSTILCLIIIGLSNNINFLNSYLYQYPGGDGFLYLYWGNLIAASFNNLDFFEFFRGGANVFYWMPGMRYFVGLEKILYGNAYYLHIIFLTLLPFIINSFLKIYLPKKIVLVLMVSFLFFPLMHHMGFSFFQFFRYFTKVFAEPVAYTIFLLGFVRLIHFYKNKKMMFSTLPLTCLIIVTSCIFRPNLTISSFFLLLIPFIYLIINKHIKVLIIFSFCGSIIFLPLLHNIIYSNEIVLFTTAAFSNANIKININDYITLITTFNLEYEKKRMLVEMLKNFIHPAELHKYFILFFGIFFSLKTIFLKNIILTPLYILIFSQLVLFFFINPGPRYMWIFWLCSLVLSIYTFNNRKQGVLK